MNSSARNRYKMYGPCCVVPKCSLRSGTNRLSKIRMFSFPRDEKRRQAWVTAIKRDMWKPSNHSRICSQHFITGAPSKDPCHPDWLPSVFAFKKCNVEKQRQSIERFKRLEQRRELQNASVPFSPPMTNIDKEITESTITEVVCPEENTEREEPQIMAESSHIELKSVSVQTLGPISERFHMNRVLKSDKDMQFYTSVNCEVFHELLGFFLSIWEPSFGKMLLPTEQLLLVLMRLRLGLQIKDLSFRFGISPSLVCNIFHDWIDIMAASLKTFVKWPSRKAVQKAMPKAFRDPMFENVRGIIDCTEIFIEKPSNLTARAQTYSRYKSHNTIKFLIAIAPCGAVTFISKCWGGRVSDKELIKRCGILDLVKEGDVFLVDRGFQCEELFSSKGARLLIPASTKGKSQLSGDDVLISRKMSRVRVHVERAIRRIKVFKILSGILPISLIKKGDTSSIDKILTVISALVNILPPLVAVDGERVTILLFLIGISLNCLCVHYE